VTVVFAMTTSLPRPVPQCRIPASVHHKDGARVLFNARGARGWPAVSGDAAELSRLLGIDVGFAAPTLLAIPTTAAPRATYRRHGAGSHRRATVPPSGGLASPRVNAEQSVIGSTAGRGGEVGR